MRRRGGGGVEERGYFHSYFHSPWAAVGLKRRDVQRIRSQNGVTAERCKAGLLLLLLLYNYCCCCYLIIIGACLPPRFVGIFALKLQTTSTESLNAAK